ncbi:hypothetical protein ACH4GP_18325 [Streptomyces celluloflavus]|uniref:Lipoprotein n=1 Tax=Streptomyces celluloflavus TaxID=58344 RepID=A0ABW7RE47_9ACTN
MRRPGVLAAVCVVAALPVTACTATAAPTASPAARSPKTDAPRPTPPAAKPQEEVLGDLVFAGHGFGPYKVLKPAAPERDCKAFVVYLTRKVLTMQQRHQAEERLRQRGWRPGKAVPGGAILTSGEWTAGLIPEPVSDEDREQVAPHKGVFALTALGNCRHLRRSAPATVTPPTAPSFPG